MAAVRADKEVISFLTNCGNKNLQRCAASNLPEPPRPRRGRSARRRRRRRDSSWHRVAADPRGGGGDAAARLGVGVERRTLRYLLVPSRLESALAQMDTDRDGSIDCTEWEECIEIALANKLEQRAAAREASKKAAAKEIEEFTGEFLNAARRTFLLIDKDNSGTLDKAEIIKSVKTDQEVRAPASEPRAAATPRRRRQWWRRAPGGGPRPRRGGRF